jgi:hypothetical protein
MAVYYKLDDIDVIARQDGGQSWLFDREAGGWVPDKDNVLSDRLFGEGDGSLGVCEMISEAEAQQAMGRVEDGAAQ